MINLVKEIFSRPYSEYRILPAPEERALLLNITNNGPQTFQVIAKLKSTIIIVQVVSEQVEIERVEIS